MIADIALALSILSLIFWVLLVIAIRSVFNKMYPMFKSLTSFPDYATMSVPPNPGVINPKM